MKKSVQEGWLESLRFAIKSRIRAFRPELLVQAVPRNKSLADTSS